MKPIDAVETCLVIQLKSNKSVREVFNAAANDGLALNSLKPSLAKKSFQLAKQSALRQLIDSGMVEDLTPLNEINVRGRIPKPAERMALSVEKALPTPLSGGNLLRFRSAKDAQKALAQLKKDDMVKFAQVPALRFTCAERVPWGITDCRIPDAEQASGFKQATAVTIAVIDTGVDPAHHDLDYSRTEALNFLDPQNVADAVGHGTHVIGTVGAIQNNKQGVRGCCTPLKIISYKAFGTFQPEAYYKSLFDAVQRKVQVINLSVSGTDPDEMEESYLRQARSQGTICVAAMGNSGLQQDEYPARLATKLSNVIAVGAHDQNQVPWMGQTRGNHMFLTAPGVDIESTIPHKQNPSGSFAAFTGTSMATAHVTGAVALMFARKKNLTPSQVRNALKKAATASSGLSRSAPDTGWGPLDVAAAIRFA